MEGEARTAVVEAKAGEGEALAGLAGKEDGEGVGGLTEVEDETLGAGVGIGGIDVAIGDAQQGYHVIVGMAEDDDAGGGVADCGLVHDNGYLGECVGGGDGYAAEA